MTDPATCARENGPERDEAADMFGSIVEVLDLTALSIDECNACVGIIRTALTRAAEEAVRDFQEAIHGYVIMRVDMAEQGIATEVLAGNVVKEARERAALAELQGLQDAVLNYWKLPRKAAQPVWSKDKPTVGLWLYRAPDGDVTTGKVIDWRGDGDLYFRDAFNSLAHIDELTGDWAPIPLPREA